jgi:hypothetical protein
MAASAGALLHRVSVASDAAASSVALAFLRRPRSAQPEPKEETMPIHRMNELLHLTRAELCDLEARAMSALDDSPVASVERARADINLRNIRRVRAWRDLAPE